MLPVLVVGGGPAGLIAALGLARRSVGVRIIDQATQPMSGSRAKGLQPRTLELLEALGVLGKVLAYGGPFPRWRSYRGGRLAWEKSIYELLGIADPVPDPSVPYPETWMIPQWRTEEILRGALARVGVEVEHGSALTALALDDEGVTATVGRAAASERVRASYVVAADGAASAARKLLGVSFEGITRDDERFIVADVRTPDLDRGYWHNFSDPNDAAARVSICPLPGTDTFQFVAPLLPGQGTSALTPATVQRLFDERCDGAVARFTGAPWIILHRTNERLADRFRVGRVFLVGDAAHVVPAAGGQGLNTAVQDSHNLAWKLAAVLRGAPVDLLSSYSEERRPIAARLMAGLDTADEHGEKPDIFQLRNNYRERSLSQETRLATGPVHAGDRAPDAPLQLPRPAPRRLFELMRDTELTCIAFGDTAAGACAAIARQWGQHTTIDVINVRRDSPATAEIVQAIYGVTPAQEAIFLVRPDGHVGLTAHDHIAKRLGDYLPRLATRTPMSGRRMHAEEVDTDALLVRRLLAAQFPQWAQLPIEPVRSAGTDNAIYRLGEDMAVRLPRIPGAAGQVAKEHRWLPRLAPLLPLAIPVPLGKGTPAEGYPWPWSVYRWLDGEDATVGHLSGARQAALDLGRFVAVMQGVDPADGPSPGEHNVFRGVPLATRDSPTRAAIAALDGTIDAGEATAAWEAALRAPAWHGRPGWIHGDLQAGNLLVRHGRLSAVIDFGGLGVGDPACDVMVAWSFLSADTRDVFRAAIQVDDATWARGRGWALSVGLVALPYYRVSNPTLARISRRAIDQVLADHQCAR